MRGLQAIFTPIAAICHSNFVPRLQISLLSAILKSRMTKSPNLIGRLNWRFAAMSAQNRGNGRTRRIPANLIAIACQILAILYIVRGDRRKLQSLHWAHKVIFADRRDWRIKSPSVSVPLCHAEKKISQKKMGKK